jgi:riboflavin biosynthesis pyrimidine reductase
MCTTIDGKILTSRWPKLPNNFNGASLFESTANTFRIPAWLVGTTTMKEFSAPPNTKLPRSPRKISRTDHLAHLPSSNPQSKIRNPQSPKSFSIAVDTKGSLRFTRPDVDGDHTIILTTTSVPDSYLHHLQSAGVSYLLAGRSHVNLPLAMRKLHSSFHIKKLLLEGGGAFNASMLHARLVDEISQIILPIVDAGGPKIPSLFHHLGSTPKKAAAPLHLLSHKSLPHGAQWLRYRVLPT